MTKFRFLALFAALALLFIVSITVLAQAPKQPHVFTGEVMVGDEMAMEGTEVTAMIDGETVGMTMVMDGMYTIKLDPGDPAAEGYMDFSGKTVMFMVGMVNVEQSAMWMEGMVSVLNLMAMAMAMEPEPTMEPVMDVLLSGLTINPGTLTPQFQSSHTNYTAQAGQLRITVTPTNDHNATFQFLDENDVGIPDADGALDGQQVDLGHGVATIKVKVTSQDNGASHTYTITVLAQAPKQPHVFTGEVMVGDEMAMEGTEVTAMIDGETVGMTMVMDGMYTIKLDPGDPAAEGYMDFSGKTVMFMVGMVDVEQSAMWMEGMVSVLNLMAMAMEPEPTMEPVMGVLLSGLTARPLVRINLPVPVTVTFSEPVLGFTVDDISLANGIPGNFSGGDGVAVYTFDVTPNAIGEVTVDIPAGVATDGEGSGNTEAPQLSLGIPYDFDGSGGISKNEAIAAVVDYFAGRITKAQTIAVIVLYFSAPTEPEPSENCIQTVTSDETLDGQWGSGCDSEARSGSHARYYSFTLDVSSEVTVTLESSAVDTRLYLRSGDATSGTARHENDDHEGSTSVSQIQKTLAAGSYTVEATTYSAGATGAFSLTISGLGGTTAPGPGPGTGEGDRANLVALYNATGGPNWERNNNWLSDMPISQWSGVTTGYNGRVTGLSLPENQLSGEIPPELGNLANLTELLLYENQLSGEIPPELGNLANLTELLLYENQLSGEIPPELGNLANLTELFLYENQLSGEIPLELGNLANLDDLILSNNQLSGEIPPELGNLANLESLGLRGNQLSGEIPPELGNLANLEYLRLDRNQLSGEIPPELGKLANLEGLYLAKNQLSGEIPLELGKLANLIELFLYGNQLSGGIPPELGNLANLEYLRLEGNQLSGEIPPELGNLGNLQELDLSGNQLSGEIPPWLGNLANLQWLSLHENQLIGEIPPELGNLANLTKLRLEGNQLSGCVPSSLSGRLNMVFSNLGGLPFCR